MKKILIATGIAALAFASLASAQGYVFSTNLTVGSTGADVVALQTWLIANGYSIPAIASGAAAKGYFGSQTKAAVMAYQSSHGIPNTGFVGPLTRGALNGGSSSSGGVTSVTCPAGYICTPQNGTGTVVTNPNQGNINTPGAEGILTITTGPISAATLNVGQTMVPVLTVRAQAQNSDIAIKRIQIDLGQDSRVFTKIFSKLYVVDSTGNILVSTPLTLNNGSNGGTVVGSGNNYYLNLTGFNYVVPAGAIKDLTIKADLYSSIDSTNTTGSGTGTWALAVDTNGVRGVDGAGIDLYGPSSGSSLSVTDSAGIAQYSGQSNIGISQTLTIGASLVDNARLNVSTDPATPVVNEIIATQGSSNNQYLGLPVLVFDVNADKDNLIIKNLTVGVVVGTGGTATVSTAYLYNGSTLINSAAVSGGLATFSNINYPVAMNAKIPLTLAVDVTGASASTNTITASTTATITALNSQGSTVTISGSATGNSQTVRSIGIQVALVGTPTVVTQGVPESDTSNNLSTSTLAATFNVQVTALGGDITFGSAGSTTPMFASSTSALATLSFKVYRGGTYDPLISSVATSSSFAIPSSGVSTSGLTNGFTLSKNNSVTIPVTFQISGRTSAGVALTRGTPYEIGLEAINWFNGSTRNSTTFMAGQSNWRTTDITFP